MHRLFAVTPARLAALLLIVTLFVLGFRHRALLPPRLRYSEHDIQADVLAQNPGILSHADLTTYVKSILEPEVTRLPTLHCPAYSTERYSALRSSRSQATQTEYFFALNLRECLPLLPRLLGSVVEAIRFLGPQNCALSIVEGNSPDGTAEVLAALEPSLTRLGVRTHFTTGSAIDPLHGGRFLKLAELRNAALKPLATEPARYADATVLFLNDVALCPDDVLELAHQRRAQGADMVCAMDWTYGASDDDPVFYDSYVARALGGDLFFDIPPDTVSYERAHDLFWSEPASARRFAARQPLQVFACWNGAVAFAARPLAEGRVAFRAAREAQGECVGGEPTLFCKDLWFHGYGKIAVVPTVNLEYSIESGRKIKEAKGLVADLVRQQQQQAADADRIEWRGPPDEFKCMPTFNNQYWTPWNTSLS